MKMKIIFVLVFGLFCASKAVAQDFQQILLDSIVELNKDGAIKEAYNLSSFAIKQYPKQSIFYVLRAISVTDMLDSKGKHRIPNKAYYAALNDLDKAFELGYPDLDYHAKCAHLHLTYQEYPKALESAKKCYEYVKKKGDNDEMANYLITLASLSKSTGKLEEAITYLKESIRLKPTDDAQSELGLTYTSLKDYPKAFEAYKEGLKQNSNSRIVLTNYGYTSTLSGDYKKAIEIYDKLIGTVKKDDPDDNPSYYYNNRGYAKMQLGKLKEAMKDIDIAIGHYPENSYAFKNRGLLHLKMKQKNLACQDFQKAEALGFSRSYGNEVIELIAEHCK